MLGTFTYELWFKSYHCFTVGSLEFLEIANLSLFPSPPPCSASRRRRHRQRRRRRLLGFPGHYFAVRWHPRVADDLLPLLLPRAGAPRPCHARRRVQKRPRRRHLAVAVESPLQWPPSPSSERPGSTNTPETNSYRPFSLSSLPRRRTPPPPCLNPGELHPAAEPPPQTRSTPTAPTISRASPSRNSQTVSPRPILTGAPSPSLASAADPPCSAEPPLPSLSPQP